MLNIWCSTLYFPLQLQSRSGLGCPGRATLSLRWGHSGCWSSCSLLLSLRYCFFFCCFGWFFFQRGLNHIPFPRMSPELPARPAAPSSQRLHSAMCLQPGNSFPEPQAFPQQVPSVVTLRFPWNKGTFQSQEQTVAVPPLPVPPPSRWVPGRWEGQTLRFSRQGSVQSVLSCWSV